jgi:hypothetical protein
MPTYIVKAPSGKTLEVTGNRPPTENELKDIFSKAGVDTAPPAEAPQKSFAQKAVDTAVDALPAIGGAAGGLIGGVGGTAFGAGVGGVPGAVGGAALGGAGGEAARQLIERLRGNAAPATPTAAAGSIAGQAALQGGLEGGGQALAAGAQALAPTVMRAALGHTPAVLAAKPDVAQIALNTGTNVSRSAIQELDTTIARTTGLVDKAALQATRDAVASAWKKSASGALLAVGAGGAIGGALGGKEGGVTGALLAAGIRSPMVLSAMANGMYHAAGLLTGIAPNVIRAAMLGVEESQK